MQEDDGVAFSDLHVCHLAIEDRLPLLFVRKCRRDHVRLFCKRDEFSSHVPPPDKAAGRIKLSCV